jgi:hypothetical protein
VSDDDDSVAPQVGFPGRNANFHRQLGPDGEEQDIIGPDGHTEQLPPYSKYPNEVEKAMALAASVPTSPTSSHESERVLSQTSQDHTEMADSGTTAPATEKSWSEKSWKERWKTKVFYRLIPCWLLVIALAFLVFLGVIIGGAIGGFLAKERQNQYDIHKHHTLISANTQTELLLLLPQM